MKPSFPHPAPILLRVASRRQFVRASSAAALTALALPWGALGEQRKYAMKGRSLDELGLATFAAQLNSIFHVTDGPAGHVDLKLIEASPAKVSARQRADAPDANHEKFSLVFSGPKEPLLAQRIYRFEHPQIGSFEIFIVPIVTQQERTQDYQAIFNRPRSSKRPG